MKWDIGCVHYYLPTHLDAAAWGVFVTFFWASLYIIYNGYKFVYTMIALKKIKKSLDTGNHSNRPVQFKDIKFPNKGKFLIINTILDTFRDLESLKSKSNFTAQWIMQFRNLENRVEKIFFKRHLCFIMLVIAVASSTMVWFRGIAGINWILAVLAYLSAWGMVKWISSQISPLYKMSLPHTRGVDKLRG